MSKILYITEERGRELVKSEVEANLDNGFIKSPEGFAQHCIYTGQIAYDIANKIINNHPHLRGAINPDICKIEGYVHDIGKIEHGDPAHEAWTSDWILKNGHKVLVAGGSKAERERISKRTARLAPPDYSLREELGGEDFPEGIIYGLEEYRDLYKDVNVSYLIEIVNKSRRNLSETRRQLTIDEYALPFIYGNILEKLIATYADLTNVGGKIVSVQGRIDETVQRYGDPKSEYYHPAIVYLTKKVTPRVLLVEKVVKNLLE